MSEGKDKLPTGWSLRTLQDLGVWSGGGTPSKARKAYWTDGTIPWVSPKDMKRPYIDGAIDSITEVAVKESSARLIAENSVLMVIRSGILEHTFPVAVNTVPVTVNQDLKTLTPTEAISYRYLAFGLRAKGHTILHDCSKDGTTVASIDTFALKRFSFPIAPLPEQHRIVEAMESYLTRLDDAVASLERVQRNLKRYRASVLKAAVEGRLVPTEAELARSEGRNYEPASVLLERILKERRERWIDAAAEPRQRQRRRRLTRNGRRKITPRRCKQNEPKQPKSTRNLLHLILQMFPVSRMVGLSQVWTNSVARSPADRAIGHNTTVLAQGPSSWLKTFGSEGSNSVSDKR